MDKVAQPIQLLPSQRRQGADVLARAFHEDPAISHVLRSDAQRRRALPWMFGTLVRYGLRYGKVLTTKDINGVAIWFAPSYTEVTLGRMITSGLIAAPVKLGLPTFMRLMTVLEYLDKVHKTTVPGSHWYLPFIGVDPKEQGRGIGTMLLQPVLEEAASKGLPCYLEASHERNVPLYERHGFKVITEVRLPKNGPPIWIMRKDPDA